MDEFQNIIISGISRPFIVHSQKGRILHMKDRPSFGLSFCMQGQIKYVMNGKEIISDENCAVLLPKHGEYSLYGEKDGLFPVINFDCIGFSRDEILKIPLSNPQNNLRDVEKLKNAFLRQDDRLQIFSIFYDMLSKVLLRTPTSSTPVQAAVRYIETHIDDHKLSNTVLAKSIGISEVYFRKQFLACYGMTPKQFILDLRIRKAKQMLTDTPFTVTAVSEACGFSGVYHFSRVFKERTGLTPSQYIAKSKIFDI